MILENIKNDNCIVCGSRTVTDRCLRKHTNGQGFESREFECGAVVEWSPNFRKLVQTKPCPKDPEESEKVKKRRIASSKLQKYINRMDVDRDFKDYVLGDIHWRLIKYYD